MFSDKFVKVLFLIFVFLLFFDLLSFVYHRVDLTYQYELESILFLLQKRRETRSDRVGAHGAFFGLADVVRFLNRLAALKSSICLVRGDGTSLFSGRLGAMISDPREARVQRALRVRVTVVRAGGVCRADGEHDMRGVSVIRRCRVDDVGMMNELSQAKRRGVFVESVAIRRSTLPRLRFLRGCPLIGAHWLLGRGK